MDSGGGFLATGFAIFFSAMSGLIAGSLEGVRSLVGGMTQVEATIFVGLVVGIVSVGGRELGVWLRWYFDRRRQQKVISDAGISP